MEDHKSGQINCPNCRRQTLIIREPMFDGLHKVGEQIRCTECGTVFEDEDKVEFVKPKQLRAFADEEVKSCRHCLHYVEHPFIQRCLHHQKEVEATDTCSDFKRKKQ